jgi:sarcosine/dimethylglycine N-methyltransferase
MDSMKTMKLYDHVERILTELRAAGFDDGSTLAPATLSAFDQFHYHGTQAVDVAIAACGIGPGQHVLEVGSGVGGPARWIAARTGAQVTALELQPDLDALARDLTRRCGLAGKVAHVRGDILDGPPAGGPVDHAVSFLCFLHIPDRDRLAQVLHASIRPGGTLYIEDYIALRDLAPGEREDLAVKVQCPFVPSPGDYRTTLERAGFAVETATDMSEAWRAFTGERQRAFEANRPRFERLHGAETAAGLADFYQTVARLFAGGGVGGVRLLARRR